VSSTRALVGRIIPWFGRTPAHGEIQDAWTAGHALELSVWCLPPRHAHDRRESRFRGELPVVTKTTPAVCPIDPQALNHFLTACQVARVAVPHLNSSDFRTLIQQLSRLSIPDAVKLLRAGATTYKLSMPVQGCEEQTFP
jgi:hypothetical protein